MLNPLVILILAIPVTLMIIDILKSGEPAKAEVEINDEKFEEDIKCQK